MLRTSLILWALVAASAPHPSALAASDGPVGERDLAPVRAALEPVEAAVAAGDLAAAERLALDAYLVFETVEPRIQAYDPGLVAALEAAYGAVRQSAAAGDAAAARAALERVEDLLGRVAGGPPLGPRTAFFHSFGILFREGIEALLLCTALAAACAKRGASRLTRAVGQGALAAIAASVVTAVLVERVLRLAPAGREAIEGVTMLLAAAVLFYVSYWLLSKLEVARWMSFLRRKVGSSNSRWALGGVAFLAVYREGVETILFYQALLGAGEPLPVGAGFGAAALALVVIATLVLRYGVRLPTRPLFAVTGALLYYLAVVFAGQGVHELQEAGWIGLTPVTGVPQVGWLGLYPSVETLAAQGLLVALALVAASVLLARARATRDRVEPPVATAETLAAR